MKITNDVLKQYIRQEIRSIHEGGFSGNPKHLKADIMDAMMQYEWTAPMEESQAEFLSALAKELMEQAVSQQPSVPIGRPQE